MGVLIVVGRLINETFGAVGAIGGAATMGVFDVDAMTVSMVRLVPTQLGAHSATLAILVGVASNTVTKVLIAAGIGRGSFAVRIAVVALGCFVAGGLALLGTLVLIGD